MLAFPLDRTGRICAALILLGTAAATGATGSNGTLAAQDRSVISNEVAVSGNEAALRLEFADDGQLEIAFRKGRVLVDGQEIGIYTQGDALEASWRALLGQAIALQDGPLGRALFDWSPEGLDPAALSVAQTLDAALEAALSSPIQVEPRDPDTGGAFLDAGDMSSLLQLLAEPSQLAVLGEALGEVELGTARVTIGSDVVVAAEETVEGTLVVVGGDVDVYGEVLGDVVLTNGSLTLHDGSHVEGDVRLVESRLHRRGGAVDGRVYVVDADDAEGAFSVERLRDEIRTELRDELRRELRGDPDEWQMDQERSFRPLRSFFGGLGGLVQSLIIFGIMAVVGIGTMFFAGERVQVVAGTVRRTPVRAGLVGLAGGFLLVPTFILGLIVLTVSIIGIPAAVVWVPLFPLAVAVAAMLGFFAVALNAGRWLGRQDYKALAWIPTERTGEALVAGTGVLMASFAAANVAHMGGPWLGVLQGLFSTIGTLALWTAMTVGFGAVLMTRGGKRAGAADIDVDWSMGWADDLDGAQVDDAPVDDVDSDVPVPPKAEAASEGTESEAPTNGTNGEQDDSTETDDA